MVGVVWTHVQRTEAWTNHMMAKYQTSGQKQSLGVLQLCETIASRFVGSPMGKAFGYYFAENFEKLFNKLKDTMKKFLAFPLTILYKEVL